MTMGLSTLGYQPPHRYAHGGRLKFHATGCRVDGGEGLPPGKCQKCADSVMDAYWRSLMRIDARAR